MVIFSLPNLQKKLVVIVEKHTIVSCGVKKRAVFYFPSIKGMLLCILYAKILYTLLHINQGYVIYYSKYTFEL